MEKWREIEKEGLPEERLQVLWFGVIKGRDIFRVGKYYDGYVNWDDLWVRVSKFSHWMPLTSPWAT